MRLRLAVPSVLGCWLALAASQPVAGQSMATETTYVSPTGTRLTVLLSEANLAGGEIDIGEITFPADSDSGDHPHGATEIFYVLEGELEHIVNGVTHVLRPGMLGFVRPPDLVRHRVGSAGPARALVIWVPGGEAARIVSRWEEAP